MTTIIGLGTGYNQSGQIRANTSNYGNADTASGLRSLAQTRIRTQQRNSIAMKAQSRDDKNLSVYQTDEAELMNLIVENSPDNKNFQKIQHILTNKNVNVNCNYEGSTPLYEAIISMKPSIVALLLEKGANPNIKCFPKSVFEIDNEGVTPAELVQEPPYVYNTPAITKMVVEASNQFPEDQDTKEQGISEGVRKLHDDDKPNDESLSYEQMLAGSRGTAIEKVMVEFNKLYEQEKYPEALKTVIPILSGNNIDYDSQLLSDDDRLKIRITKFKA